MYLAENGDFTADVFTTVKEQVDNAIVQEETPQGRLRTV